MQTVSDTYRNILADYRHVKEHKASIAGVEYDASALFDIQVSGSLFSGSGPCIGAVVSRELDLSVIPQSTIPKMAEIKLETRLVIKDTLTEDILQASEWIPKGTFYIDTRTQDYGTYALTIHAYDAMLKAEQMLLTETTEDDWPKPMDEVVEEIAKRMGVTVDSRTVISHTMMVGYPLEYTMREILGYIAAAHCGNWIITDAGELRLITLNCIPPETSYLVDEDGYAITFGGVRIIV